MTLVARAVHVARTFLHGSGLSRSAIVVDTDDPEIAEEGRRWGARVPFLRPSQLAADDTPTATSVLHLLDRLEAGGERWPAVLLLQPTSPLRTAADLRACWAQFDRQAHPSVISLGPAEHPVELALELDGEGRVTRPELPASLRRQEFPRRYFPSGSAYLITTALLRKHQSFLIPGVTTGIPLPASRALDIDTMDDLAIAERLIRDRSPSPVLVAGRSLGPGASCLVIAEAGVNHNGELDMAHRLVDAAADAGADVVKFQTFQPDRLVSRSAPKAEYQARRTGVGTQRSMLAALTLPVDAYRELAAHAAARGVLFLSTPFDPASADFLESLEVPAFKIPSGEITNHPFLAHVAAKGRPILLSTGMSTLAEVGAAVDVVQGQGAPLALFHCVTSYPAAPSSCNLRAMETMRLAFDVPVGWSDHTSGLEVPLAAAVLGASMIEKHLTLDRRLPGPDHQASLEPDEFRELVRRIRSVQEALGDGMKEPVPEELPLAAVARRSLHLTRNLPAGHVLGPDDLESLRPGGGFPPFALEQVLGRSLGASVRQGAMLRESDLA